MASFIVIFSGVVFFFHLQRPMSWQGIQTYLPHLEEGHVRTAMDLEFHLEASKVKQVGKPLLSANKRG